jgi:N-methylhydantoinase A
MTAPERAAVSARTSADASAEYRPVWFAKTGFIDTPVYDRAALPSGASFAGPAVIEQMDATTVVPPDATAAIDPFGNIDMRLRSVADGARGG